jgi:hypothetical protein
MHEALRIFPYIPILNAFSGNLKQQRDLEKYLRRQERTTAEPELLYLMARTLGGFSSARGPRGQVIVFGMEVKATMQTLRLGT